MDGNTSYTTPYLTFNYNEPSGTSIEAIYFYAVMNTETSIINGTFYSGTTSFEFARARLYGTNTDPSTFSDPTDSSNWTEILHLTKYN